MDATKLGALVIILALASLPLQGQTNPLETYKQKCAMCHGEDGKGQTAMGKKMNLRDLGSPEVQKMSDQELYDVVAKGKNKMPGYETQLGAERVKALVQYMRTLGKEQKK